MAVEYATPPRPSRAPRVSHSRVDERVRLRAAVLRLGGLLGWQPREVIAFAEAVVDRPWRRCGQADFEAVLEEYRSLLQVIKDKAERRAAREKKARLQETDEAHLQEKEVQGRADCS